MDGTKFHLCKCRLCLVIQISTLSNNRGFKCQSMCECALGPPENTCPFQRLCGRKEDQGPQRSTRLPPVLLYTDETISLKQCKKKKKSTWLQIISVSAGTLTRCLALCNQHGCSLPNICLYSLLDFFSLYPLPSALFRVVCFFLV